MTLLAAMIIKKTTNCAFAIYLSRSIFCRGCAISKTLSKFYKRNGNVFVELLRATDKKFEIYRWLQIKIVFSCLDYSKYQPSDVFYLFIFLFIL